MSPRVRCKTDPSEATKSLPKPIFVVRPKKDATDTSVPIQYEIVDVTSELDSAGQTETKANSADSGTQSPHEGNCDKSKRQRKTTDEQPKSLSLSLTLTDLNPNNKSGEKCKSKNEVKRIRKVTTDVARKKISTKSRNGATVTLLKKLCRIVYCLEEDYFKLHFTANNNNKLLAVQSSVRDFSVYMSFVERSLKMANVVKQAAKDAVDELNRSKPISDTVEQPDSSTVVNVSTKKNPKAQRSDNTRLMLIPETKVDINEKDLGECVGLKGWVGIQNYNNQSIGSTISEYFS